METNKVKNKQIGTLSEAITYLEALVQSFKNKKIVVQQGENYIALDPGDQVFIEVGAKRKKEKAHFSLKLSWQEIENENEPIRISSKVAAPKPPAPAKKASTSPVQPAAANQTAAAKENAGSSLASKAATSEKNAKTTKASVPKKPAPAKKTTAAAKQPTAKKSAPAAAKKATAKAKKKPAAAQTGKK